MKAASGDIAIGAPSRVEARSVAWTIAFAFWPALIVLALAIVRQATGGLVGDVSWLITAGEELLDGKTAYVDFIETNPPAALFVYLPAIVVARLFGTAPEFMVVLFCFLGVGGSLALCRLILRRASLEREIGPVAVIGAIATLALLPAHAFAQREHIAVVFALPFFATMAARAAGARVEARLSVLAGLGAGIMISLKPHFALMIATVLPYLVWRIGWRSVVASLEFYVPAAVLVLHAAVIVLLFPAYLDRVAPLVLAAYLPVRYSWSDLASGTAFVSWLVLVGYLVATAREKIRDPLVATPALASLGGMAAYFVQAKAWPYQSYPALALIAIAVFVAAPRGESALRRFAPAVACLALVLVVGFIAPATKLGFALMLAPVGLATIGAGSLGRAAAKRRGEAVEISTLAFGFVAAVLWTWFDFRDNPFSFEAKAAALTAHPKVMAITGDLNVGFPFVRRIGGVWAQRTNMLWLTVGASWRIHHSGDDPAMIAAMQPYLDLDKRMLIEDLQRSRPDLILISNRIEKFRDWAFADPAVAAALTDYRLYDEDPAMKTALYARADLLALRSTIDEAATAKANDAR
jgi:hypothetical protein